MKKWDGGHYVQLRAFQNELYCIEIDFKIYIGGRWGKRISHGQALTRIFTEEEEVMAVIEKAILLFKNEGIAGERFADTVKRLGFEYVNEKLIG